MDPETFIFHYQGFQNHAGATVAIIKCEVGYYAGVALCNKKDKFDPKQGEIKAIGKAASAKMKNLCLVADESELPSLAAQILLDYYRGWINRRKALANLRYMRTVTRLHTDEVRILGVGLPGALISVQPHVALKPPAACQSANPPTQQLAAEVHAEALPFQPQEGQP